MNAYLVPNLGLPIAHLLVHWIIVGTRVSDVETEALSSN